MKQIKKIMALGAAPLLTLLLSACTSIASPEKPRKPNNAGNDFVVLELFTSEGCSSCPAAEELLEQIQKESAGRPVYILAYHVDYFDRLGWKDSFGNHNYSNRQYEYSEHFSGEVYTPQLVVNGLTQGVGSDESFVRGSLTNALAQDSPALLTIHAQQQSGSTAITYETKGATRNTRLEIVVVQKHARNVVTRGENAGRTLSHTQIVRSLSVFDLGRKTAGIEKIDLPKDFNAQDWEIIGLLKNTGSDGIIAADRTTVNNRTTINN
jgi:hypothetical protein